MSIILLMKNNILYLEKPTRTRETKRDQTILTKVLEEKKNEQLEKVKLGQVLRLIEK
jgi:hypothetical protein